MTMQVQPCPAWCTGAPGHHAGTFAEHGTRSHERVLHRIVCSESTPRGCAVDVTLAQLEVVEDDGRIERLPPGIFLCGIVDVADDLSAGEARELAAALLDAAAQLDRLGLRLTSVNART